MPEAPDRAPVLVACSHGTSDPAGRATVTGLIQAVRAARPGLDVRQTYVDVEYPQVAEVVAQALADDGARAVVVPLLLSAGYHVNVDIRRAVRPHGARAVAAEALGPDPVLVDLLLDRLREVGAGDAVVVLAAAGSSDERAARDVAVVARGLEAALGRSVPVGYGSVAEPRIGAAVEAARTAQERVVVAAYILAPGFFYDVLLGSGADAVTAPLAPHPHLVDLVLARYDAAVASLPAVTSAP